MKHWRWQWNLLHPPFKVTAPLYSEEWRDEIVTEIYYDLAEELAEERFIETLLRIERQRIIEKLELEANASAEARHAARQAIIDRLLKREAKP